MFKLSTAAWDNTRFLRNLDEVRQLKLQPGKDIFGVGGAALVSAIASRVVGERRSSAPFAHRTLDARRQQPAGERDLGCRQPGVAEQ